MDDKMVNTFKLLQEKANLAKKYKESIASNFLPKTYDANWNEGRR